MLKLTDQQQKYLEALEWLISDNLNIGSGRTFLLAYAFVNSSVKHLGRTFAIFDHIPTLLCTTEIMAAEIQLVAKELYPLGKFKFTKRTITFKGFQD